MAHVATWCAMKIVRPQTRERPTFGYAVRSGDRRSVGTRHRSLPKLFLVPQPNLHLVNPLGRHPIRATAGSRFQPKLVMPPPLDAVNVSSETGWLPLTSRVFLGHALRAVSVPTVKA